MRIKPEYEKEMLEKILSDLDTALLLLENVTMSLALSNFKELNTEYLEKDNIEAYNQYSGLYTKVTNVLNKYYE